MTSTPVKSSPSSVTYPDSDGKPMSDNTLQFDTIAYIVAALRSWFLHRLDVFVAGDLLWYYEDGNPKARIAPDGLIAFGRPPGYRGSYKQWEEDGICPQVVFEVLSPKNTRPEMRQKYNTYARLGCREYYEIDPYKKHIVGFEVIDGLLSHINDAIGRHSSRLGLAVQFDADIFRFVDTNGTYLPTSIEAVEVARVATAETHTANSRAERLAEQLRALGVEPAE